MNFGPWELGLVVLLVLIVFGAGKLPQIGDAIGKTIKNIRNAQFSDIEKDKITDNKTIDSKFS